ncbi:MAG TPA: hydroxymethylbilane synthase [Acidimicrobiales bacterium]|nr:hydroxymethylbilane synthase [Acidimicrobiales bacterium]
MGAAGAGAGGLSLRIATRGSPLALIQARAVADRLERLVGRPLPDPVVVRTTGDLAVGVPVERLAGQGAFVKEVQAAVLDGRADLTVHSAKDLPSDTPDGLVLACVPERGDPRDVLVGSTLRRLAPGAQVATGSVRRRAQLAWLRPDLSFCELRGNMRTRLGKSRAVGAGVMALAALVRLGQEHEVDEIFDTLTMLPQVGQGALAVECRREDEALRSLLSRADDADAHEAVRAERAFLGALGGGCTLPVAALARRHHGGLHMEAMVASADGHVLLRAAERGQDAEALGMALATELLDGAGGRALLDRRT